MHIDFRPCYRYVVRPVLAVLLVGYFLFAVALISLRYLILPAIGDYRPDLERFVSGVVHAPVRIGGIDASWMGLHPRLDLRDVNVFDPQGRVALALPRVSAVLSWRSLMVLEPRLIRFRLDAPQLDIRRDAQGRYVIGGLVYDPNAPSSPGATRWLFSQRDITIRGARVRWTDDLRQAPPLELRNVALTLRNGGLHHRAALRAAPPAELASPLDLRADFTHSLFDFQPGDMRRWRGTVYTRVDRVDLGAIKQWADLPATIDHGAGAVRAWATIARGAVNGIVADLAVDNAATRLGADLPVLEIARATAHIDASRNNAGHRITISGLDVATPDGVTLKPSTLTENWQVAGPGGPARGTLEASGLEVAALDHLADRLPLPETIRNRWVALAPEGRIENLKAGWEGAVDQPRNPSVSVQFTDLSMKSAAVPTGDEAAHPQRPGFTHLSGSVDLDSQGGAIKIDASDVSLSLPGVFAEPVVPLRRLVAEAHFQKLAGGASEVQLTRVEFEQPTLQAAFSGTWKSEGKSSSGTLDIAGKISRADATDLPPLIPLVVGEQTRHWLNRALVAGTVNDVAFKVQGDLRDFPFADGKPGQFHVGGRVQGVTLDYVPQTTAGEPFWPRLEALTGDLAFDRISMTVNTRSGRIRIDPDTVVELGPTRAAIAHMGRDSVLEVDGEAHGPGPAFLQFVHESPVGAILGGALDEATASGNFAVPLSLHIPLDAVHTSVVHGQIQFAGNEFRISPELPALQRLSGVLAFGNDGVSAHNVMGMLLDGPVRISGSPQPDGTGILQFDGTLPAGGLAQLSTVKGMARLKGQAAYSAKVVLAHGKPPTATLDSNLVGMAIDLPAPLGKAAPDALPLHAEWGPLEPGADGKSNGDWLAASVGKTVNLNIERDRDPSTRAFTTMRAAVGVNRAATMVGPGLGMAIDLPQVDVDAWTGIADEFGVSGDKPGIVASIAGMPASATASAATSETVKPHAGVSFPPLARINLKTASLLFKGRHLDNVSLYAARAPDDAAGNWRLDIDSTQLAGRLTWRDVQPGTTNRLTARLTRLIVGGGESDDHDTAANADFLTQDEDSDVPEVDLVADQFELFGKSLGRLEVLAQRADRGREWRLSRLSVKNPDAELEGTGVWRVEKGDSASTRRLMTLDSHLKLIDTGKFLDRMGMPHTMRSGSGTLSGRISWRGLPYSLDLPSLEGQIELDLDKGQFLKADPGITKLLGVLSLQSLPRRVTLDFRDIFSEGFAYDTIRAHATIANGVAHTDDFKMNGVNATVVIAGDTDMVQENQSLRVVVVPKLDAGAAPLLYGLAVNPAVGLSVFLAQWLLRGPLAQALTYQYAISGSWADPHIERIANQQPPAEPAKSDAPAN